MSTAGRVEVAPERLPGWVERFAASHGRLSRVRVPSATPVAWQLDAADGSWARLTGWSDAAEPFDVWALPPALLLLLVRRGGYAVAVVSPSGELVAHKVGTRHVQSRTAAGGWSQQRYARRRGHQADALVGAVVGHAARVLGEGETTAGTVGGVVTGGDRTLAAEVLAALATGPLTRLHGLPSRELPDLADPRRAVLDAAAQRARAVRVEVHNAEGAGAQ
ncbi:MULTISPECIES: acVLRF1 family peptidyl-tRNA hydrolase [unclassified Ornithinimicrobium]|uniref:acVLRF1 family peptidyl-tRNA hydrolase n=1 Tax=unclassified Ornithinimicrobium TaxID=2615080 RepID=UPI0038529AC8